MAKIFILDTKTDRKIFRTDRKILICECQKEEVPAYIESYVKAGINHFYIQIGNTMLNVKVAPELLEELKKAVVNII